MANDKTYDRHVNIWINGKEVKNSLSAIKKEMYNLANETNRAVKGSDEYNQKAAELRRVRQIYKDHKAEIDGTGGAWTKVKDLFSSAQGFILAGVAGIMTAYQTIKGVLTSTGSLADKLEVTLGGWKAGVDALARSIATLDFENMGKNIRMAIEEGRRYAESLDEIDEKTRALRIQEAQTTNELNKQRQIQNDVRNSLEKRNEAGKKALKLEEDLARVRTGIAQQAFDNELENITKIANKTDKVTDAMKEEILLYLSRNEAFMKGLEPAKAYRDIMAKIAVLRKQEADSVSPETGQRMIDNNAQILNLQKQITQEMINSDNILTRVTIPTDEKYLLLTDKWVNLEGAKGSAIRESMKIFTKNANIEKQLGKEHTGQLDSQIGKYAILKTAIKDVETELTNYLTKSINVSDPEEASKKKREAQLVDIQNRMELEQENSLVLIDLEREKNELLRREEIAAAEETGASILAINEKYAMLDQVLDEKSLKIKLGLAAGFFGNMSVLFGKQTAVGKAAAIAETTINTYAAATASYKALAGIPYIGPALGIAAAAAAIAAGLANVKNIIKTKTPGYAEGGYTGAGDKYTPAGIVHAGEWVANQELVASPVTGPIIQALEQTRVNGSYANGGVVQSSNVNQNTSSAIISSDPELKALIRENIRINKRLAAEGVRTNFTYSDVDNVRKGINKIDQIEQNVSM